MSNDISLSPPANLLPADEDSGFIRIQSNDFNIRFMFELVFNVNNIVDHYPSLQKHPYFAPLEVGQYIAILDGNYISHLSDTRSDSLSPWNKARCKSKQHSWMVDETDGSSRRADTREERAQSNAKEYYAKHPYQNVMKRIFLATGSDGFRPKANTFVVIFYKVERRLTHQCLVNPKPTIHFRTRPSDLQDVGSVIENEASNIKIKEDPDNHVTSLLDTMLFNKDSVILDTVPHKTSTPSTDSAIIECLNKTAQKRPYESSTPATAPTKKKGSPKITILNPVQSSSSSSSTNGIRKRQFGLFDSTPYLCDPPDLRNKFESSHLDELAKNYYKSNNLVIEAYHTSFPFQIQKGKDLLCNQYSKRKCAHCNADISIDAETTVITKYEPFEYLMKNSNYMTMGHGNRFICIKFSCLKARYPFIDEKCFVINNSVPSSEAQRVFNVVF